MTDQSTENNHDYPNGLLHVDVSQVLDDSRRAGLDVSSIDDFRNLKTDYPIIENLMNDYRTSYARYSALGGATTGIGGISTSITLSSFEVINTAIQLYRLSQRYAIVNGFDPRQPLHFDKAYNIYLKTLGFKATTQFAIKYILYWSSDSDSSQQSLSNGFFAKLVKRVARKVGTDISSGYVGKLVPFVGGAIGAYTSYNYAYDTGDTMKDAFKKHYFKEWHNSDPPENIITD